MPQPPQHDVQPISTEGWHTVTMRIPFYSPEHTVIAKRSLEVDREQNAEFVLRTIEAEGKELVVTFRASTVRLLRLASNSFLSSCDLVMRTMEEFAPDADDSRPRLTDEELKRIREESNSGGMKGIELRE